MSNKKLEFCVDKFLRIPEKERRMLRDWDKERFSMDEESRVCLWDEKELLERERNRKKEGAN